MDAIKTEVIGGKKIELYRWGGELVVYVDNKLTSQPYESACEEAKRCVTEDMTRRKDDE